jgi:hypothetical protein
MSICLFLREEQIPIQTTIFVLFFGQIHSKNQKTKKKFKKTTKHKTNKSKLLFITQKPNFLLLFYFISFLKTIIFQKISNILNFIS